MERKILKSKAILESKVADLEGEDEVMDRKVMALKKKVKELNDDIVAFNGTVMDVNENIADLTVRIQNTTEDVNGAVLEIEGKVVVLNEEIADLGGQLNATTDDLNDLDEAVTGVEEKIKVLNGDVLRLDEKFTNADVEVEGKVVVLNEEIADLGGQLNTTTDDLNDLDGAVTGVEEKIKLLEETDVEVEGNVAELNVEIAALGGQLNTTTDDLEEKIKRLEEALDVALKVEEIQFLGVASQSSNLYDKPLEWGADKCNDGFYSNDVSCHSNHKDPDPWWKLTFTKDVVINRIKVYSQRRMKYTAGNRVSILSAAGSIVWEHTIEKEEKPVYIIDVPNVVGQNVKIDKLVEKWVLMKEVVVFGRYD